VKRSFMVVSFLLMFLMLFSGSALAQGPAFCGDLADEDCDILMTSQEVMQELTSGQSEVQMEIFIGGIPDAPFEEIAVSLVSSSAFTVDPEITMELMELQGMSPPEMMGDMDDVFDLLLDIYRTSATEIDMTIFLSEELAAQIAADSNIMVPDTFAVGLVLVDGVLYFNLDDLINSMPELAGAGLGGWFGVSVVELLEMSMDQAAGADQMDPMSTSFLMGLSMNNNEAIEEFVDVERLDDETVDGQDVAVFLTTFDYASFLASPMFREMVMMQMEMTGDATTDPQETEEMLTMVGLMAPMLLTGLDAGTWQSIGLDDLYLYRTETYFEWDLSSLMALAQMADESMGDMESAPLIRFESVSQNSDFDADIEIVAPDGAMMIPTEVVIDALAQ